jgi:branched-chain amino acid transport system substrate-binding protein
MTKFIIGVIIGAVIVWGGSTLLGISGTPKDDTITIGFIGPLTGDEGNIGENVKAAVEIAVAEVNEAGGINGRTLEVIYEDGQCTGKAASNAANKLINVDKVPVILGGACSGETLSFTEVAEETKTVVLSYCSSAPSITEAGDYIFRDYPSDAFQGEVAAGKVFTDLGKKKVAVLYANNDWGVGVKSIFIEKFEELGGVITIDEGYDQQSRDLRTQLTKVKETNPDLVYFIGYSEASIPGIKQAAELGINVPLFGTDAWDDPKIFREVGAAGDGVMYTVPQTALSDEFKAKMRESTGSDDIVVCTPGAYDGIHILAGIMEKVGTDPEDIKNELYLTTYTGGVSNEVISFDANGDLKDASYALKVVKDGVATVQEDAMMEEGAIKEDGDAMMKEE